MTQLHYLGSIKDDRQLDPQFKSLLKHHWMEEAQHAKLDTLMIEALAGSMSRSEIEGAVDEYLEIAKFIDGGLAEQVRLDLESLTRKTGRDLSASERESYVEVQLGANRWTYLGSGMTHPNFLASLEALSPAARGRIERLSPAFC